MSAEHVYFVRHGETEWSRTGRHTSTTDLHLTNKGVEEGKALRSALADLDVTLVLTSPLERARRTCELAGFGDRAEVDDDLIEWRYGDYEGLTRAQIRERDPGWTVWERGAPNGESPDEVAARVDRVIKLTRASEGNSLLFAHGHILRVLSARWIELGPAQGAHLRLDTGTFSELGYERETPVIRRWNVG
jgi:broad specificity phosphatase PhoE